ncbi:MAG: carnitine dehydratase [Deltaproteobacteria bacterium]|nr:MAG: carnitine dehydratase [Deltaproteobacteria bacterium]
MSGPLTSIKVVEFEGLGPAPFCAMMLSDMGADVVRIENPTKRVPLPGPTGPRAFLKRGRESIKLNLKEPNEVERVLELIAKADALIEGFRPGVMERLGLGPDRCLERNPRLAYGRMTGWGQNGPLANHAGHDINYIALSGALSTIGPKDGKPTIPLNLIGDFGGGGMLLAFGILCAVFEASKSGKGQVVDAAMLDGAALLTTMVRSFMEEGLWQEKRGTNLLDGGAHFYNTYECADGAHIALGSIEPTFYASLLEKLGICGDECSSQHPKDWLSMKERLTEIFKSRTRAQWEELLDGENICFAPVLSLNEAPCHPHNKARGTFIEVEGVTQPAPAPRFSKNIPSTPLPPGVYTSAEKVLRRWRHE